MRRFTTCVAALVVAGSLGTPAAFAASSPTATVAAPAGIVVVPVSATFASRMARVGQACFPGGADQAMTAYRFVQKGRTKYVWCAQGANGRATFRATTQAQIATAQRATCGSAESMNWASGPDFFLTMGSTAVAGLTVRVVVAGKTYEQLTRPRGDGLHWQMFLTDLTSAPTSVQIGCVVEGASTAWTTVPRFQFLSLADLVGPVEQATADGTDLCIWAHIANMLNNCAAVREVNAPRRIALLHALGTTAGPGQLLIGEWLLSMTANRYMLVDSYVTGARGQTVVFPDGRRLLLTTLPGYQFVDGDMNPDVAMSADGRYVAWRNNVGQARFGPGVAYTYDLVTGASYHFDIPLVIADDCVGPGPMWRENNTLSFFYKGQWADTDRQGTLLAYKPAEG